MSETRDDQFGNRADAHIRLSHQQVMLFGAKPVTESMVYGTAWFAAWQAAQGSTADQLREASAAVADQYTQMFRTMIEEHLRGQVAKLDTTKSGGA